MSALGVLFQRDGGPVDAAAAARMLEAQRYRGPDAQRLWTGEGIAIGHALLATTPEDGAGAQPYVAEGGAIVVAFDGRLDNREELASALGVAERGAADAALVAAAHARWGEAFTEHLTGDFALALWDTRRRALVCARDVVGARPLYYREAGGVLACASSPRALFAATGERPAPSFEAMALFLVEQYVERPHTLFEGVAALPPGASLRATAEASYVAPSSWPAPVGTRRLRARADYEEELASTLREAVRARLRAAGPVAAHVSGGVDSSSVATLAAEVARERGAAPPLLLRCVFPGLACDESAYSQAVADHLGLPITSVVMPGDLAAYLPDPERVPPGMLENPISHMLTRMIDAAGERGARVALTGAGSDQVLQRTGLELAGVLGRGDVRAALAMSGVAGAPLSAAAYRRLLREGVWRVLPARLRGAVRRLRGRGDGLPAWLTERARRAVRAASAAIAADRASRRSFPTPAVRELAARFAWNADYSYSLALADQIAAAKGADLRHPFFDRRVIELLLSFPDEVRAARPPAKALLRGAMGARLPPLVRERTDAAEFSPLVKAALVEPHAPRIAEMLRRGRLAEEGLVDGGAAADLVLRARGDDGLLREVMVMVSLELWLWQLAPPGASP